MWREYHLATGAGPVIAGLAALLITASASAASPKNAPAKVESIDGSNVKRVILTAKAAGRLDVKTAPVREQKVVRWLMVPGEVEIVPVGMSDAAAPGSAGTSAPVLEPAVSSGTEPDQDQQEEPASSAAAAPSVLRVRVSLAGHGTKVAGRKDHDEPRDEGDKEDDFGDDDDEDEAEIVPPSGGIERVAHLRAKRIATAAGVDSETAHNTLYFEVEPGWHNLKPGQRVGVRLASSSGTPKKVIPYSAVMYDVSGDTWVYTNTEPLVFIRHRVTIQHIDGEMAVLKDGPATGTEVVTVGAAELFGAETGVGH